MGITEEIAVLSRIPMFAGIAPAKLKLIAFASQRVIFEGGEDICMQGEEGDCAYVVISGQAEVLAETEAGPRRISIIEADEIVGEIAVLADVPRTATVRAIGPVVTLRITKDLLVRLIREFPDAAEEITRLLARRLHVTTMALATARVADSDGAG